VRRGFTLIEILVVLAIMVTLFGIGGSAFARRDQRLQSVKAAAEELAATCRQARAMALARNATYAVVFHIQNQPQSSGRVLNNRSGGHGYRILGPSSGLGSSTGNTRQLMSSNRVDNVPAVVGSTNGNVITSSPYNLAQMAAGVRNGWAGELHVLPAGRVRFLALTDMDYGNYGWTGTRRVPSATVSYPRPWFGWWDATGVAGGGAGRLYPWGGYDPAIPGSGFFYWGPAAAPAYAPLDPQPIGSTHAAARVLDRWLDGQQVDDSSGNASLELPAEPKADLLYAKDAPRPLVDGDWRDMSIQFCADGTVQWGGTMPGRHCDLYKDGTVLTVAVSRGAAERCNGVFSRYGLVNQHSQAETGNFERDAGGFHITLAPDVENDNDVFATAKQALDAQMPAFRVFVSVLGEVRVIAVSRTPSFLPGTAPFPASESWWRTGTNMRTQFGQDRLVSGSRLDSGGTGIGDAVGAPITSFLLPEMLVNRSVWMR